MMKVGEGVGVEVTMSWVKAVTIDSCCLDSSCWNIAENSALSVIRFTATLHRQPGQLYSMQGGQFSLL